MDKHYQHLGINSDASDKEVKRAFRKRAKDLHPDKNNTSLQSEEDFKDLQDSYDKIMDKRSRDRQNQIEIKQGNFQNDQRNHKRSDTRPTRRKLFIEDLINHLFGRNVFSRPTHTRRDMQKKTYMCIHKVRQSDICLKCS